VSYYLFFFFSSRRRHTRCLSDWSSDVCSSDLPNIRAGQSPQAWWDNGLPVQNDGIENLSLDHTSTNSASGIFILNGNNNWVKNRSEEHTSELQSLRHLVCRLLLEKKKQDEG